MAVRCEERTRGWQYDVRSVLGMAVRCEERTRDGSTM